MHHFFMMMMEESGRSPWNGREERGIRSRGHLYDRVFGKREEADRLSEMYLGRRNHEGGWIEGPYLYKHAGKYYLLCAEGGTGYHHCASMGRADTIWEPYEPDPKNPIITSILTDGSEGRTKAAEDYKFYNPDVTLQKSGHASIVETPDGRCYALVFTPVTAQASMSVG